MIDVYVGGYWFRLIEFPHQFVRRWQKALRARRFMYVRYAGRDYYLNPSRITLAEYERRWLPGESNDRIHGGGT